MRVCLRQSGSSSLQKKSYNCLEAMLSASSDEHQIFLKENLEGLRKVLVESLSTATIASKKVRYVKRFVVLSRVFVE